MRHNDRISLIFVRRAEGDTVKVSIDPDKCEGHGRCFSTAPLVFDADDLGQGVVIGDGTVPADQEDLVRLCQQNCPEYAIEITE
jgi:ferredoxin